MKMKLFFIAIAILMFVRFATAQVSGGNGISVDNTTTPGTPIINLGGTLTNHVNFDLGSSYKFNLIKGSSPYLSVLNNGNILINSATDNGYKFQSTGGFAFLDLNSYAPGSAGLISAPYNADGRWGLKYTTSGYGNYRWFAQFRDGATGVGNGSTGANVNINGVTAPLVLYDDGVHYANLMLGSTSGPANVSKLHMGVSSMNELTPGASYPSGVNNFYLQTELSTPQTATNTGHVAIRAPLFLGGYFLRFEIGGTPGTEAARFDNSGNFGLGTATPTAKLHVSGSSLFNGPMKINSTALTGMGTATKVLAGDASDNLGFVSISSLGGGSGGSSIWSPLASSANSQYNTNSGNIIIGSSTVDNGAELQVTGGSGATYALTVNGTALFTKAVVKVYSSWPDYVFSPAYPLLPLGEVERYIQENKHLPELPSAEEVKKDGVDLGNNQALLLKKIEELTLYVIQQDKKIKELEDRLDAIAPKTK